MAGWSARQRWPVFVLWLLGTVGLFVVSLALGGTRAVDAISDEQRSKYESTEAFVVFDAAGTEREPSQQFLLIVSRPDGSVADPAYAAAVRDMATRMRALESDAAGTRGSVFANVVDPTTVPPAAGLVSADGTTVRIPAAVPGDGDVLAERLAPVPALVDDLRASYPGYTIYALNNTLANDEISALINEGLDSSLQLTIPLTFLILLIAFGAAVAAAVPLVLAVTALLAAFGILGLYSQVVAPVSPYAGQLVVLIGLAVAVDYSLFMVTRFRSERAHGRDKLAAIHVASNTAGRAVFFSGVAVMISIGGLFLLDDPLFHSMAIGTISVILVAVVGSLTFLPATLAILGDGVNRLRVPILGRPRQEGSGAMAVVVRAVMRRPVLSAAVTAALLLVMTAPLSRLHMGQADFTSFPDSLDAVAAINLLNEKWPEGSTLELQFVVTRVNEPAVESAMTALNERVLQIDGLSGPPETTMSGDGTVALVSYVMSGGANDLRNRAIVRDLRADVVPGVFSGLPGVRVFVAGDAARSVDIVDFYTTGLPLVMAFVLALSFALLLIAFRSIVIPLKAILLNLLSTGAALGLLVLIFQEGWGAGALDFKAGPIEAFVPVFIFTILFGLSMDYHVFILTRVKEARDRGLSSNEAVARGIAITSGTITSAAAIMVVVFAVFVTLEVTVIKQLGFGLAVAVLIDATVVRSVLLPASMRLLGDWNWWLPPFLRWLPEVTIEGSSEHPEPASANA